MTARRIILPAIAVTMMVTMTAAQAGIYTFVDANGVIHFTNKSSDPRYAALKPIPYPKWPIRQELPARTEMSARYDSLIALAAREHELDRALLKAVIAVESAYNPLAVSPKGAKGLMQLMPETARRYGVTDIFDPVQNVQAGARHLRELLRRFNDDLTLTLAAYNAGEEAVVKFGWRVPPYHETRQYVPRVLSAYGEFRQE